MRVREVMSFVTSALTPALSRDAGEGVGDA